MGSEKRCQAKSQSDLWYFWIFNCCTFTLGKKNVPLVEIFVFPAIIYS
jgi:hypothetical protein